MGNDFGAILEKQSKIGTFCGINITLVLIVVGLLLVFFLIVFPLLKSKKEHDRGLGDIIADTAFRRISTEPKNNEHFSLGSTKEHASVLGEMIQGLFRPAQDHFTSIKEKLDITAPINILGDALAGKRKSTNQEHMDATTPQGVEPYKNLSSMTDQELRVYVASLSNKDKQALIDVMGPDNVAKLNEKMGGNILAVVQHMSDFVQPNESTATGSLSPVASNDIDNYKLENKMCSKSCCSSQWGVKPEPDDRIKPNDLGTKFLPTNYMCSGDNPGDKGNGCVCVDKDTFSYLGNRGGNNIPQ